MDVLDNSPSNSFFIDKLRESGIGKASSLNNPRKRKRPEMPVSTTLERPGKKPVPDVQYPEEKCVGIKLS